MTTTTDEATEFDADLRNMNHDELLVYTKALHAEAIVQQATLEEWRQLIGRVDPSVADDGARTDALRDVVGGIEILRARLERRESPGP